MLSDFFKSKFLLPPNFLRTVFQAGTGIYRSDDRLPGHFGALYVASNGLLDLNEFESDVLAIIERPDEFKAGYFQNSHNGVVIYCHYENGTPFDLYKKSSLMIVGNSRFSEQKKGGSEYKFEPHFVFLGDQHKNGLIPQAMYVLQHVDGQSGQMDVEDVNVKHENSVAKAFCYGDLSFLDVLADRPLQPQRTYQRIKSYSGPELVDHFSRIKDRSLGSLEREAQISSNVPLNTYDTGPVI